MRLTDILKPQNLKIPLAATTKNAAIAELVQLLADNGLAIPHGKCNGTPDLVMAIGKPAQPIDFQAIDGKPVTVIWMLTSPPDKTGPHIHALARISRLMTIDKFQQALRLAKTPAEVIDAVVAQEAAL